MYSRALLLAAALAAISCSRPRANPAPERIAILRFENLSGQAPLDWMGRAFSEIVARDLEADPQIYALSMERLHASDGLLGPRPAAAPGISAERELAEAAGATLLGYGQYAIVSGRLHAQLTLEDAGTGRMRVIAASAAPSAVAEAAGALARQITPRAGSYTTQNSQAVEAYVLGLETADPETAGHRFEQAIAADPNFGPPYERLAQIKARSRDSEGALALLRQALARGNAIPPLERARLAFDAASIGGDAHAREQALGAWAAVAPNDPLVWRSVAESRMNRHEYGGAVQAYQTALVMQPNDVSLLNSLGYAAGYAGDLSTASRALQHYQSLRPGDANPIDSMGDVNLLLGRLREAENLYLQAAKKNPNFLGGGEYSKAAIARLMSGDPGGAGELYQHFLQARAKDPLLDSYKAQWDWLAGRRKEGLGQLQAFAQRLAGAPATREAASRAYSELAVWNVALGDRKTAQQMAEQAVRLAGPPTAALAAIARFIAQPAASATEWAARADAAFPQPAQKTLRDTALAYALLGCSEFEPARRILQARYDTTSPTADDDLPILLAWADLETGKTREAATLLRFNPLPSAAGPKPFTVFAFPRLFYLRGRLAGMTGSPDQARAEFRTFLRLSGDQPLAWGEELKAR